jgi:hypothetical protein
MGHSEMGLENLRALGMDLGPPQGVDTIRGIKLPNGLCQVPW